MKANKIIIVLCIIILMSFFSQALSISGKSMKIVIDHVPGYEREDVFYITSNENYISTYDLFTANELGASFSDYVTITPNRIENVNPGEKRSFTVKLSLPDYIDHPGKNMFLVQARIDSSAGEHMLKAFPSVAILYVINVLRIEKYAETSLLFPNLNEEDTVEAGFSIYNLGQPEIRSVKGNISVMSDETGEIISQFEVPPEYNIKSWERRVLTTEFESIGLSAGNYKAFGTLYWDENKTELEKNFAIGNLNVNIINFTKLFEYEAINKFDIEIESRWNTKINNVYADIQIFDKNTGQQLKKFKSINTDLNPWEIKVLDAYFDTKGLEKGEYTARVTLQYGSITVSEDIIEIDENIGANLFDEIPGKFKFSNLFAYMTTINILYFLILLFVILNIILLAGFFRRKKKKEDNEAEIGKNEEKRDNQAIEEKKQEKKDPIENKQKPDPAVVDKIKDMRKQYKDEYIKEMMLKKGWSEEKVELILKEAKKQ